MIYSYKGHFIYDKKTIENWNSIVVGVYYCGYKLPNGNLDPLYIGSGTGESGIRGRLLDHMRDDYWPDITHFGYRQCGTVQEAVDLESQEIANYKPKYNKVGK